MKILNIRYNFATNSSSSHSILYLNKNHNEKDKALDDNFGWQDFTASSKEEKINYLASCVFSSYKQIQRNENEEFNWELENAKALEATKKIFPNIDVIKDVDHQSLLLIPSNFKKDDLNIDYIKDLEKYLLQDEVVIIGGNDNDETEHHLASENKASIEMLPKERSSNDWVARKTKSLDRYGQSIKDTEHWVLFNSYDGQKIRFIFNNEEQKIEKSASPELADICITSWCAFDCKYCYQNSNTNGSHSDIKNIEYIAKELSKNEVFEVAIGGGEPTLHPQFKEIAKIFKNENIIFNFTTKNLAFFKKQENIEFIKNNVGAFAYSVANQEDIDKLIYLKDNNIEIADKITAQYVMGSTDINEFKKILEKCIDDRIKLTLLGYKEIGRGNDFTPYDYSNWFEIVKSLTKERYYNVNIDTKLAGDYEDVLKKEKISNITYHTTEGAHSIYIDAVKMKMYPSSYIGLDKEKEFNDNWINEYKDFFEEIKVNKKIIKIKK